VCSWHQGEHQGEQRQHDLYRWYEYSRSELAFETWLLGGTYSHPMHSRSHLEAKWARSRLGEAIRLKRNLGSGKRIGTSSRILRIPQVVKTWKHQQDSTIIQQAPPTKPFPFFHLPTELKELVFFAMLPATASSTQICGHRWYSPHKNWIEYRRDQRLGFRSYGITALESFYRHDWYLS
jgi:hypothetical protein